jgi:hypothetical protein
MTQRLRDLGMRETDKVLIASNMPPDEFPDVLDGGNGEKLYRHRDKEIHDEVVYMLVPPVVKPDNPAEPKPEDHDPAVLAMGMVIAEALAEQENLGDVDDLGDGESIVLLDRCPVLNITQLAEAIVKHQRSHKAALEAELKVLRDGLEGR